MNATRAAVSAVVLCGGGSRRYGRDKTREPLDGIPVLDWAIDPLPVSWEVVCVGAARPTRRPGVRWVREQPSGGGPVAAAAAGLAAVTSPVVVLLGGDMPFAGRYAVPLTTALGGAADDDGLDAVVATDPDGRTQPLLSAARTAALRAAVPDHPRGQALMGMLRRLHPLTVALPAAATMDIDTPEDFERALAHARTLES